MLPAALLVTLFLAPAPKHAPDPALAKKVKACLHDGRALEDKHKLADAIAKFKECRGLDAEDAAVLSELGWTAYQAKDLALAEEATRKSIAAAQAPNIKGASLYNLGRILEDKNDSKGAIAAYKDSLRARPNAVVAKRLAGLDAAAAARLAPFTPSQLMGPYRGISDYCKKELDAYKTASGADECTCGEAVQATSAASTGKPSGPIEEARAFWIHCDPDANLRHNELLLGVRTGANWWVVDDQGLDFDETSHCDHDLDKSTVAHQAPGVVWTVESMGMCSYSDGGENYASTALVIVGVGPSGKPSATPALRVVDTQGPLVWTEDDKAPAPPNDIDVDLGFSFDKDGAVTFKKTSAKGLDKDLAAQVSGRHAIVFP
jgi:hypothetical protein